MARCPLSLDDALFPCVVYRQQSAGHTAPFLRGSGLRVQTIVVAAQDWHWPPEQIANEYGVAVSQVREALAFYQAHQTEIDAFLAAEADLETRRVLVC